jgi:phage/plasmid-associated DNA primase
VVRLLPGPFALNLHKALVLYGDGGNGKSVILDVLAAMVPYHTRLEWHELNEQRNLERLSGSWVNIATEISYKDSTGTTGFKKAVAGEMLTANPSIKSLSTFGLMQNLHLRPTACQWWTT